MERLPPIARAQLQRPPHSDHLDADLLTSFAEQSLPPRERQQVLEHLSRCAQCREVAVLAGAEPEGGEDRLGEREFELVATAAASSSPPSVRHSPAGATSPPSARNRWFGQPRARWIALAAGAALCATMLVRYPALWRGKDATEPVSKTARLDQIAANRPLTGRAGDELLPVRPAPPGAEKKALRLAAPARPATTPSRAAQESHAESLGLAASTTVPKPARPVAEQPQTVTAPVEVPSTLKSPAGTADPVAAGVVGGVASGAARGKRITSSFAPHSPQVSAQTMPAANAIEPQWSISEDGIPQRSDDSGHTWQKFSVNPNVQFRALYADQKEIWVGGPGGTLYHSSDMGANWTRVRPTDGDAVLSADVARIDFKDRLHGEVITANSAIWTTSDGGVSWLRH